MNLEYVKKTTEALQDAIDKRDELERLGTSAKTGLVRAILRDCYFKVDEAVGKLELELARAKGQV